MIETSLGVCFSKSEIFILQNKKREKPLGTVVSELFKMKIRSELFKHVRLGKLQFVILIFAWFSIQDFYGFSVRVEDYRT